MESLFLVMSKRRQEQELLKTRLMVESALAPHVEKSKVGETFDDYANAMFPFLKAERRKKEEKAKEILERWTGQGAMRVTPMPSRKASGLAGLRSKLELGAQRVRDAESARRSGRLKRI